MIIKPNNIIQYDILNYDYIKNKNILFVYNNGIYTHVIIDYKNFKGISSILKFFIDKNKNNFHHNHYCKNHLDIIRVMII